MNRIVLTLAIGVFVLLGSACGGMEERSSTPAPMVGEGITKTDPDIMISPSSTNPTETANDLLASHTDIIVPTATPDPVVTPNQNHTLDNSIATPEPTLRPPKPLPETSGHLSPEPYPYSLEQQIMLADIVVVATFQSVAAGTETMSAPEGEQATYRPVLTMTFQATEYLKGTGPGDFTVELRGVGYEVYRVGGQYYRGYLTQADALAEATRLTTARDTKYDDRPGILFLRGPITPVPTVEEAAPSANTYGFVLHHRKGSFDYSR